METLKENVLKALKLRPDLKDFAEAVWPEIKEVTPEPPAPPPPPPPSPSGKWLEISMRATKINRYDGVMYFALDVHIEQGQTYYFLIDPKAFMTPYASALGKMLVRVWDPKQGATLNLYYPTLYKINTNADQIKSSILTGAGDFSDIVAFTRQDYDSGNRFILEIKEHGLGSGGIKVMWAYK